MLARVACLVALSLPVFAQEPAVTFGITVVIPSALQGRIYNIRHNTKKLPDFRKMKPVGTIYTTSLNIPPQDFQQGFPGVTKRFEWFAIDYSGRFWVEKAGDYGFSLTADDGANLYIDRELVIDNDGQHPARERIGAVPLIHGVHEIRVSYFQGPRFHVALVLKMAAPGEELRIFNTDEMKPPPSQ
jgi:PA14 domain